MPNANVSKVAYGQRLPVVIIVATFGQMSSRNASNRCCLTALSRSCKKHQSVTLSLHIVALNRETSLKDSISLGLNAQKCMFEQLWDLNSNMHILFFCDVIKTESCFIKLERPTSSVFYHFCHYIRHEYPFQQNKTDKSIWISLF